MHYFKIIPPPNLLIRRAFAQVMLETGVFARLESAGWIVPVSNYHQPDFFVVAELGTALRRMELEKLPEFPQAKEVEPEC
jgi:hypothetical protein